MALADEEIRRRLVEFAAKWSVYDGSERAEAQTFLNELFRCYGSDRGEVARFEDAQHGRFLDLIWDRVCLIEMKRPSEARRLSEHRGQAFDYWRNAADAELSLPAPRYVVLCAFTRFEIWEPGSYPNAPRAEFDVIDLPDRADALLFLAGAEPVFVSAQEAVTREAVSHITGLYQTLNERRAGFADTLRDFVLQCVWCMFAEDLGQLERHLFTRIVEELIANPHRSSADDLGGLFRWLNTPGERPTVGLYADTRYVNGGLFENPAAVHLTVEELETLRRACDFDWKPVEPHIFGSLLEGSLGEESQWALGAHYTHAADIDKVVRPSIVVPWRERIGNADTVAQAQALQAALLNYVVLDPACGSGNFLYLAYRELRRIERDLHERLRTLRLDAGMADQGAISAFFPLHNIRGIEINGFAVALARVTLWMGHKLAVDELGLSESTLPLGDLSGIQAADALRVPWPRSDVIIGNPPFHGDRNLRGLLGDAYLEWLEQEFRCGIKDHCVYWFRKAHDHLEPGQRAGLVGTNSISQNRARGASLDYVVEHGGVITDAVSSQDWPGAATVEVSIVNWVREPLDPPAAFVLDARPVDGIDTALRASTIPIAGVPALAANAGVAFQGFLPGAAYDITRERAVELLALDDAPYAEVVLPYLDGRDITRTSDQSPSRFTIDFAQMTLEEAMRYPAALAIVREQAKAARETSNSYSRNPHWWQFLWPRPEFRARAAGLPRFIAGTRVAKRICFVWCEPHWRPSDSTNVFALEGDYAFGVLLSSVHTEWARAQSSTLRVDIRYTPSSAFETFPWPDAADATRERIAVAAAELVAERQRICAAEQIGLTALYNQLEEGAWERLTDIHAALERAVLDAYGWTDVGPGDHAESNRRLFALNAAMRAGDAPAIAPGR